MWRLVTRNWSANPGRCLATLLSIAIGVSIVLVITTVYETARRTIRDEVLVRWMGSAHLTVFPPGAHWGSLDASLTQSISQLNNVAHVSPRLTRRMRLSALIDGQMGKTASVDAVGIDPATEVHFQSVAGLKGRWPMAGEQGVAAMERETADDLNVALEGRVVLQRRTGAPTLELRIVGLFDGQRLAEFQHPVVYLPLADLQQVQEEPGQASAIDVMLSDPSPGRIAEAEAAIEKLLTATPGAAACKVESAAARTQLMDEADRITRVVLGIVAFVAMLTSFFIILTTMSMSLFERRQALGILRCVGMTRSQMVQILFAELVPLGMVGTVLGLAMGLAVIAGGSWWLAGRAPAPVFGAWGIGLAVFSGLGTVACSGLALTGQVSRASPLGAINTQALAPRRRYLLGSGVIGLALIGGHEWLVRTTPGGEWLSPGAIPCGVGSLYLGYMLLAPALVLILGPPAARCAGFLLRLPGKLAVDQFGRAPWRSTGVCWVLMVGLSLMVYMSINAESILAIWDFPSRLPGAFVWTADYAPRGAVDRIRALPGVREVTTTTDVDCEVTALTHEPGSGGGGLWELLLGKLTRPVFVAGDPDHLLSMLKVAFTQGVEKEAMEKIRRGGYVLIPVQTAKNLRIGVGDRVRVTILDRWAEFEIAGVIQSPAMDIAVTAFQATSYMQFAAASAILGTEKDLADQFDLDVVSMVMCNVDIPHTPMPLSFGPRRLPRYQDDRAVGRAYLDWAGHIDGERAELERIGPEVRAWLAAGGNTPPSVAVQAAIRRYSRAIHRVAHGGVERERKEAWSLFRERLLLLRIAEEMGAPDAVVGSLARLKENVERTVRRATLVVALLPMLMLGLAVMGIGNLMAVSVAIRARQIAMLRAIGALKSQIVRLILAEGVALGVIGAVVGIVFGFHQAWTDNRVTEAMIGFRPEFIVPGGMTGLAAVLAVVTCVLAVVVPARRAAQSNIVAALSRNA